MILTKHHYVVYFLFDIPPFIYVAMRFNEEIIPTDWAEIKGKINNN